MARIDLHNIDFSRIKKEYLILASGGFVLLIVFLAVTTIFKPLLGRIKAATTQIEKKQRDIERGEISPQALKELADQINKIRIQIDYYQQRLSAKLDVPQILKELNRIAERLKIKIVSVNPLTRKKTVLPGEKESLLQTPIRIKMECGYHQLGIFVNQIENSLRFMKITGLKINADTKNIWQHQVELAITSYTLVSEQDLL